MTEYNFQKELEDSIFKAEDGIDKKELLVQIFKSFVAKLFEHVLGRKGADRLELSALVEVKRNLINEFRNAKLSEYQRSEKFYEELFDTTVQEIFNDAGNAHQGQDIASVQQTLQVNPDAYVNEGGLFIPEHMKKR